MYYGLMFDVYLLFFPLAFMLVELASERTHRKPMYERGWFWYSHVLHAERI